MRRIAIMRNLRRRLAMAEIAAAVAFAIALAAIPQGAVVFVPSPSGPSFTLDICHPLQSLDRTADIVPIARPAIGARPIALLETPRAPEASPAAPREYIAALDPPPPESCG